MSSPVPHPGARPGDFVFPFTEARAALDAVEQEIEDLAACSREHDSAAVAVCQGFEGRSRANFEAWLADGLARLAMRRQQLGDDADELRRLLAEAGRRRAEREAQQRAWQQRKQAYDADQREQRRLAQAQ